jgi:hypothetical protein
MAIAYVGWLASLNESRRLIVRALLSATPPCVGYHMQIDPRFPSELQGEGSSLISP